MRFPRVLLAAIGAVAAVACEPHRELVDPIPTDPTAVDTAVTDTTGWERIDLWPGRQASVWNINDEGMMFGSMRDSGHFVYRDGVMQRLLTGPDDSPQAMNSKGQIAGVWVPSVPEEHGIIAWDTPVATRRLELGPSGTGGSVSIIDINDAEDILAQRIFHDGLDGHGTPVLWRNGVRRDLGYLADTGVGPPSTYARAMNARGQIVGTSKVKLILRVERWPGEVFHPFIWEDGAMRDLGVLGHRPCAEVATPMECAGGEATDINTQGVVVGTVTGADGLDRAFIFENGLMRDLGAFPGQRTRALAINDHGQVLAIADTTAFLWQSGEVQIVGPVFPRALGAGGEVIWSKSTASHSPEHAYVWVAGQITDLGEGSAQAINSRGDIVVNSNGRAFLFRKK